jgi:hypothetical protein
LARPRQNQASSLTDFDNLLERRTRQEIIENLEAGLNSFHQILAGLEKVA